MPTKNLRGKKPALKKEMKKISPIFQFSASTLFDNLSENDKKDLLSNCSLIFNNPAFKKVGDQLYTQEIESAFLYSDNYECLLERRGFVHGLEKFMETIEGFHSMYMDSIKKQESFDRQEII
jgi:hypothetical protein